MTTDSMTSTVWQGYVGGQRVGGVGAALRHITRVTLCNEFGGVDVFVGDEEVWMLHYRLFVEVNDPHSEVEKRATQQLHSWLRSRRLNADALVAGREVALGSRAVGSLAESVRGNRDRSLRAVITQTNRGTWTTQLTVHVPANTRIKPWLWLDLNGPDHIPGKIPGIARSLLEVFDAATGAVRQGEAQLVRDVEEVAELVDAVCDPLRRTLVFVAGSDPRFPLPDWIGHVRALLRECVGLVGGYVLTPEATVHFNNAIGPVHEVAPWTVRTFRPGVEPDNVEDGRRHKVLSLDRMIADSTHRLARMLGRRAREAALETPLPTIAMRVDRDFAELINADLVASLDVADTATVTERVLLAPRPDETHPVRPDADEAAPVPRGEDTDSLASELPTEVGQHGDTGLLQALEVALGGGPLTIERIVEWGDFAELGRRAISNRNAIASRLDTYEMQVAALDAERQELRKRLENSQLDTAAAEDEHARAAAEVRRLQKLLIATDQAPQVWVVDEATEKAVRERPQDCEDLASRLGTWRHITFTGQVDALLDLDQHDPTGGWAAKIWDIMGTLDDYAQAILEGNFDGSVHTYLSNTPPGLRTFSATRHADSESAQVRTNPKLAALRTFPVPAAVNPAGKIFMGAHFKIAQSGIISPRLHYYNDVRETGRIYIGYIGKHLRNSQTN